jgi:hypothetical protein
MVALAREQEGWTFSKCRHALRNESFRAAVVPFALTRTILFAIVALVPYIGQVPPDAAGIRGMKVLRSVQGAVARLRDTVLVADARWYLDIAENGYERASFNTRTAHNWAFFPLYPVIVRLAANITKELALTGMVLSNVFFFAALVILHKTTLEFGFDKSVANRSIFYLAAFPTSYFYSVPMTESLFLLLTVIAFYAAKRNQWFGAGLAAGLASATRFAGIVLLPSLALGYWEWRRSGLQRNILSFFLMPVGLLTFMVFLHSVTGDYFAFRDVQVAFGRPSQLGFFLRPLVEFVVHPTIFSVWNLYPLHFACGLLALIASMILVKEHNWSLALYTFLSVAMPLSGLTLASLTRYVMVIFPVYLVLANRFRSPQSDLGVRIILVTMLALMTTCYATRFGFALA